ncbi:hypothetical protein SAMN04488508_106263 [Aquimarina spongiae]|uniref:Uncharacterized protein n=1 Tax=Aquimarina spongiae TaxID=570521 RepID=A0A1M6HFV3_9FLAO|nr:hypothetical protein SAMN04488508_106263 [Aquimarina spongiae]
MINKLKNLDEINLSRLKHIKFEFNSGEHIAILIDHEGYEILKGYGDSQMVALNDLHENLI